MDHSSIASQTQAAIRVHGHIDAFFDKFRIGTLLHPCGIRKRHGHSVRSLTQAILTLLFTGQNFYRGIFINQDQSFGKDAAYDLLKGVRYNWFKLLQMIFAAGSGLFLPILFRLHGCVSK